MKNNLVIDGILLMESHFSLKKLADADMYIYEIIDTSIEHNEDNSIVVIHAIQFNIEEVDSKELIAETFLKYGINISTKEKYSDDAIKEFAISRMNQLYLSKANEFFTASHLPVAKSSDLTIKHRIKNEC